jgi:predicted DNA-binding transcriptional regulator YafY
MTTAVNIFNPACIASCFVMFSGGKKIILNALNNPINPSRIAVTKRFAVDKKLFSKNVSRLLMKPLTPPAVEHLRETPLSLDQQIEPDQPGWMRVQATVPNTAQLRWWLLAFGGQVEVLEPSSLREEFVNTTQSLHSIYHAAPA